MSYKLIALDKHLEVRLVSVEETLIHLFEKSVLKVMGPEDTNTFQDNPLCDGIKSVIDGVVHGVQVIWDDNSSMENWDFILMDAKNAFNEINCIGMLWTVHHLWPFRARFVFNCYFHWSWIFLHNKTSAASFLHSMEGVT